MPTDDVVAELDDWLAREATTLKHYPADDVDTELLERARDEIVALRKRVAWLEMDRDAAIERSRALNHGIGRREGAEEMRERAAAATTFCCFECSRVIRALPLTPEEPA